MLSRTSLWAEAIFGLTILLLVTVAIRSVGLRGRNRAFAVAFSTVGMGYCFLIMVAPSQTIITNVPLALSAKALDVGTNWVGSPAPDGTIVRQYIHATWEELVGYGSKLNSGEGGAFFLIGHCVWSWLFALLGGWYCSYVYSKYGERGAA